MRYHQTSLGLVQESILLLQYPHFYLLNFFMIEIEFLIKFVQNKVSDGHLSMNYLRFVGYYFKLRLSVLLKVHHTANPLNVKWRWKHWQRMSK